nr:unnamed protein product [Digitaria exilis]
MAQPRTGFCLPRRQGRAAVARCSSSCVAAVACSTWSTRHRWIRRRRYRELGAEEVGDGRDNSEGGGPRRRGGRIQLLARLTCVEE